VHAVRVVAHANKRFTVLWEATVGASDTDIFAQTFLYDGKKHGSAFAINQTTAGHQRLGDASALPGNALVVVWEDSTGDLSGASIKARLMDHSGDPAGNEIDVNAITPGDQTVPAVATLDGGDWVVAWVGADERVWTRRYDADGEPAVGRVEHLVNTISEGDQANAAAATAADGRVMLAWASPVIGQQNSEIRARIYDGQGGMVTSAFQVNTFHDGAQTTPAVGAGGKQLVAAWTSDSQDGSFQGIFAQRFDTDGVKLGAEIAVNTTTEDVQHQPAVALSADDKALFVWNGYNAESNSTDIYARLFGADGQPLTAEFIVNSTLVDGQEAPSVAAIAGSSDFIVTWQSYAQDGDGYGVFMARVGIDGAGSEVAVSTTTAGHQLNPRVTTSKDGRAAVCWETESAIIEDAHDVACQLFNLANLNKIGDAMTPHVLTLGQQQEPAPAFLPDGSLMVAWSTELVDGSGRAIQYRRLAQTGQPIGARVVANRFWDGDQRRPVITTMAGLDVMVAWQSADQDGDGAGIFMRAMPQK